MTIIKGVLPVVQLPFHEDFSPDYVTLEREIDWLFGHRADGVVIALASEILRLSDAERDELVRQTVLFTGDRGPVIASVGAESSAQAVRHARAAAAAGASALMAIPPALTRCDDQGLLAYYAAILDATPLPLVVQDASGYMGQPIPIPVQAALFERNPDRVMFKPEAQPLGPTLSRLRQATGGRAAIFEGTGGLALVECHRRGASGTMPGSDLVWAVSAIWSALQNNNEERARRIHLCLAALISLITSLDAFLAVEKLLLVKQGIFKNELVRGPVGCVLDAETRAEVSRLFEMCQQACA